MEEKNTYIEYIKDLEDETFSYCEDDESNIPFDPKSVNIFSKSLVVDLLMRRIKNKGLDLHPDFQRRAGIWNKVKQCRLIESLLIKIPIPSLYFDASNDNNWIVIDGLQRLSTIYDFVNDKFALSKLEFLHNLEGLKYSQLPSNYQMRIDETEITSYLIMPGTPLSIKFDIFRRINTGGMPLSQQEIRHALNIGPCTELLSEMASMDSFKKVVAGGVSDVRMADRECILRYLAFSDKSVDAYTRSDFNGFLCDYMADFNKRCSDEVIKNYDIDAIKKIFSTTMEFAYCLFGENAFRLPLEIANSSNRINKALFEAWSVNLAKIDDDLSRDFLLRDKQKLEKLFVEQFNQDVDFRKSVTQATAGVFAVQKRFETIRKIINEVIYGQKTND